MSRKKKDRTPEGPAKKADAAGRFAGRGKVEDAISEIYTVRVVSADPDNTALVAVLKDGFSIGRYSIREYEYEVIDDVLVLTNLGGRKCNGTGLAGPTIHIGYLEPVEE